jgi:hypothetical protein
MCSEDNIKLCQNEMFFKDVHCIELNQDGAMNDGLW